MVKAVSADGAHVLPPPNYINRSSAKERVYDVVLKQAALLSKRASTTETNSNSSSIGILGREDVLDYDPTTIATSTMGPLSDISAQVLDAAYARCGEVCAEYAKTFSLGG